MKTNKILIISLLISSSSLIFMGCDDKSEESPTDATYQEKKSEAFRKKISIDSNRTVSLLPEAKEATSEWPEYMTTKNEIRRLPDFTLQEVVNNSNNLLQSVIELEKTIPEHFQVVPVQARINVLLTKVSVLNESIENPQIQPNTIDSLATGIHKAFGDLEIQLNEVFLKTIEDFEFELDEEVRRLDTLPTINSDSLQPIKSTE